ncbi:MAG TPA: DUF2934 domain-containing protein [Rhodospirillales bacterium]|nr:DUF2934 domain-containing protein [Rhodospirillales bacterium]
MSDDKKRRIEKRANEIWQREGCPDGRANEHWRLATAEIEEEDAGAAASLASAAPAPEPAPEAKAASKRSSKPRASSSKSEAVKGGEPKKTVRKKK